MNAVPLPHAHHHTTALQPLQPTVQTKSRSRVLRSKASSCSEWVASEVVHSITGRVRLRVPALKLHPALARPLEIGLSACPGIRGVWTNQNCASLTISFDPKLWTAGKLCTHLQGLSSDRLLALRRTLASAETSAPEEAGSGFELVLSTAGLACVAAEVVAAPLVPFLLFGSALPMLARAFDAFGRRDILTVDVLDASATTLLACQGQWPMALFMVWLINLGDYIRDITVMQAQDAVKEVLAYRRTPAWVVRNGRTLQVNVEQVEVGETVVVYPGERIPVDGTVLRGKATVDQQALTGESVPVEKAAGDVVHAATVVQDGKLYARADRVGEDTEAARIVQMVQDAPAHETRIQNYAECWANELVPYSFAGAAVNGLMSQSLASSASVLIIDYGTGIRIAAPTAVLASMTKAVRHGILIKGGRSMEQLSEIDAIVFDKTGTLTTGSPQVTEIYTYNGITRTDVLGFAAACEQRLTHPVAKAIVLAAESRGIMVPERSDSHYTIGLGVEARVDGHLVHVGCERFMTAKYVAIPAHVKRHLNEIGHEALSPVCVAVNGELVGTLAYADPVRQESADVIQHLRDRGINHIAMLTGDHAPVAARVAAAVGISDFIADALPGDKVAYVQELQRKGFRVAVVGDGINDSPALAHADVGIAVSGGADVAEATAQVVLLHGGLWKVPLALDISRDALDLIQQNWKIISVPNTVALGLAVFGAIGTGAATLLSNGSAILATANALRPLMASASLRHDGGTA
ncbi:MAG: heavy metal translocating P-type ATPase [Nitrospiraceae bacterium]